MYYAHGCTETGRWFVCKPGVDNNMAECFEYDGRTAAENADDVVEALGLKHRVAINADLLAACKRIMGAIEWAATSDRMPSGEQADVLRAAIAKAEGGDA